MNISPLFQKDAYKVDHQRQYPEGTQLVYSNWTPRASRDKSINEVMFFGLQYWITEYLGGQWYENFFEKKKDTVLKAYKRRINNALGPNNVSFDKIADLHDLGYLPIRIDAVPEGTLIPLRVPMLIMRNTLEEFFWLTNSLETSLSNILWMPCTSATIAFDYLKRFHKYAKQTGGNVDFIPWQGHDFSYRGMTSLESACTSGAAHLLSFTGTDTIPAIDFLEQYYGADSDKEMVGGSVAATEHSVMCLGGNDGEINTFERLMMETYPSGIISIVSDTWDYWTVITKFLPTLKDKIMSRQGKVVIRPDSGDPVKIVCGDPDAPMWTPEYKGSIQYLWEIFGGTVNAKGFKTLDSHIGLIYGDSITRERQEQILSQLAQKGFASDNIVLGIGSFTYQYNTRDTFGFAVKATGGKVNGKEVQIFKDPKTDNGTKKSAKGFIAVIKEENKIRAVDQLTLKEVENFPGNLLRNVFLDGTLMRAQSLSNIRQIVQDQLKERI